jgi:20S proteasome alpha/beta subunit
MMIRFSIRWYIGCFFTLFLTAASSSSSSSSSSNNYNAYNYDMTTPQFTPDGRLLQVEYASAAADLSSPLVVLQLQNDTLVLLTIKKSNTQNRMALLQQNSVCIAMSGVLADSVALLQAVLQKSSQNFQRYKKELTLLQIANVIADACQQNSFGGGIRPYGSTMLVCGFCQNKSVLYQTDPSGAIIEAPPVEAPNQVRWMIGGSQSLQRQLRRKIDQALDRHRTTDAAIADMIALVSDVLVKETRKLTKGTKEEEDTPTSLEIVVLSPSLGVQRLTKDQLDAIQQRNPQKK